MFVTGDAIPEHWKAQQQATDFYDLKSAALEVIGKVTNANLSSEILEESNVFEYGMALCGNVVGGNISFRVKSDTRNYLGSFFSWPYAR